MPFAVAKALPLFVSSDAVVIQNQRKRLRILRNKAIIYTILWGGWIAITIYAANEYSGVRTEARWHDYIAIGWTLLLPVLVILISSEDNSKLGELNNNKATWFAVGIPMILVGGLGLIIMIITSISITFINISMLINKSNEIES